MARREVQEEIDDLGAVMNTEEYVESDDGYIVNIS